MTATPNPARADFKGCNVVQDPEGDGED